MSTTSSATEQYSYDELGNLRSVVLANGDLIEYVIDGQNRRIAKKLNGAVQYRLVYKDQLEPIAMVDGTGAVLQRYVYGTKSHVPDYVLAGGIKYRIVSDHLGSVRFVVNTSTGAVVQRMDYDEFGRVLNDSAPGWQPFGYAGGIVDGDTGLVRFGARDYDAQIGRWTAKDPVRFDGGWNHFAYVDSEPINSVDITGLGKMPPPKDRGLRDVMPDAKKDADEKTENKKDHDALRHCIASCDLSQQTSNEVAETLGDLRELRPDNTEDEKARDKKNNKCGREAADQTRRENRPKDRNRCVQICTEKLASGEIQ